jgi:phosphoserine phosphatase
MPNIDIPISTPDNSLNKATFSKFSAVVPSYNEDPRFIRVVSELFKIPQMEELIFVDDGSTDDTEKTVKQFENEKRFVYVKLNKNKGKGFALKTGVKKAKNEVVLFLDADLGNITSQKIFKIVEPVLLNKVDMARGSFSRARGRVTEFAVKPMMEILFPSMYFDQPISGQICAKKSFLLDADFADRYGVDIGLLFDAIESGQRIVEVNIGSLVNRKNPAEVVKEMSRQVLETMISKAGLIRHKYKMVLFTLDNTLICESSSGKMLSELGIEEKVLENFKLRESEKITAKEYLERNAKLYKGMKVSTVEELSDRLLIIKYAKEVVKALIRRKYKVGIISSNFSPIVESYAKRLGISFWNGVCLEKKNGKYTGNIKKESNDWMNDTFSEGFTKVFNKITKSQKIKSSETIMVAGNEFCLSAFKLSGLSVAFRPKTKTLKESSDKTIRVLAELLAIIE